MGLFGTPTGSQMGGLFGRRGAAPGTRMAGPQIYKLAAAGLLTYLASNPRALQNILGRLQQRGLGRQAGSWVGVGPNEPVSPYDLDNALGSDEIRRIAHESGVDPESVRAVLAEVMPNVVDKLTPHGDVPPPNILQQGIQFLRNSLR